MTSSDVTAGFLLCCLCFLCNAYGTLSCPPSCVCRNDFMKCLAQTEFPTDIPPHITHILMDELSVETIPPGAFKSTNHLSKIEFTRCNFGSVSGCAFRDLGRLEEIIFTKCVVGSVDKMAFSNIYTPTSISILESKLTAVQPFAFTNLHNLSSFVIMNTTIHNIKPFSFYNVSNIVDSFQWTGNTLLEIERNAFTLVNDIGTVSVMFNKIETLPCGSMDKFISFSNRVSFRKNLLNCDCGLQWVRQKLASLLVANIIDNACYRPEKFANKTIIQAASSLVLCDENNSRIKKTSCDATVEVNEDFVCPTVKPKYPREKDYTKGPPDNAASYGPVFNFGLHIAISILIPLLL